MGRTSGKNRPNKTEAEAEVQVQGEEDVTKSCAVCKALATSRCGGCQKVGYCSREHQKQHWKDHKGECCAWKVSESAQLGRYLEAVRDIKPGEIIMQEKPLLITPPRITPPICLGCYSEFKPDGEETDDGNGVKPRACPNGCGWPMCQSNLCANSKGHEAECEISKARGKVKIRTLGCEHPLYQSVGILRALAVKEKDPDTFAKLMSLEANVEKRKAFKDNMEREAAELAEDEGESSNSQGINASQDISPEVTVNLMQDFFQRTDVNKDWMLKLIGVIETNGHEIPIADADGHINRRVIGIYHNSSFLEHNCQANCTKSWNLLTKEIVIRSCIGIKKGSHLSIAYIDPLWGTNDRQHLLQASKFFTCKCARCTDPSELGCHISSLKCRHPKCTLYEETHTPDLLRNCKPQHGMVVPEDPLNPERDWKCYSCGEDYSVNFISCLIQKAGQEMGELSEKVGDIQAKEDFLKRFNKTLSPNHFYLLEIRVELAQLYGRTQDEPLHLLPPKKLLRKIQICEELVILLNVITPGYNRLRALILYELQAAVFTLSRIRRSVGEISMEKHLEELMQCGKWMTEVVKVLGWEAENSIERKRAAGAERDLELLKDAVLSLQGGEADLETVSTPETSAMGTLEKDQNQSNRKSNINVNNQGTSNKETDLEGRSHLTVDDDSFIEEVF